MSDFQLACIDLEGTCISDIGITENCFVKACQETGIELPEGKEKSIHGLDPETVIQALWRDKLGDDHVAFPHRVKQTFDAWKAHMEKSLQAENINLTPGCEEAIAFLHSHGIKVAILSGLDRWLSDIILEKLGWLDALDFNYMGKEGSKIHLSVCREDVDKGRPAPDLILYAMDMFDVMDPEYVINIGDTTGDLRSARKAQVGLSLAVTNGNQEEEKLEKVDNHGLLESLLELPSFLEEHLA